MTDEQKAKAAEVAAWLAKHRSYDLKPALLRIQGEEFVAVEYKQDNDPLPGARNQERYTVHGFYCLGPLPASKRKRDETCFTRPDDEREWYIASYTLPSKKNVQPDENNPGGRFFLLFPWTAEEPIDRYEPRKYVRIPFTVTE